MNNYKCILNIELFFYKYDIKSKWRWNLPGVFVLDSLRTDVDTEFHNLDMYYPDDPEMQLLKWKHISITIFQLKMVMFYLY